MTADKPSPFVPKLRFPEFIDHGPWDAKPLDDLCDRLSETVGDTQLTPVSISAGKGFVPQAEKFGRDISGSQYSKYIWLQRGDFAYNRGNSKRFPQGCVYQLTEFDEAAASNAFHCFRLHDHCEPAFVLGFFENNGHGRQLIRHITSGTRSNGLLNISAGTFFGITFPVPPTEVEQQKIADCLGSLDDLIVAEAWKLEALRQHKQGLMQQLFPRPGETVPQLRFPEFADAPHWQTSTFGERCESFSGSTPDTSNRAYYGGTIPFIRSAEIGRGETEIFLTEEGLANSAAKMVKRGDLLVALYGANSGDTALARIAGAINQAIMCLRSYDSAPYLYHYLTARKNWIIATYLQGGQGNLSGQIVLSVPLSVPRRDEQEKVADCLSTLDAQIEEQAQRIVALRRHRQGLLQQLFPSLEGP